MKKFLFICLLLGASSSHAVPSGPLGFNFSQGGYTGGATVTGMFYGSDLDGNGQLSSFNGEVSGFMMNFSGNGLVSAFSLGVSDLFGLVYDLNGGPLGDGFTLAVEGIGATDGIFAYNAGPGPTPNGGEVFGPTGGADFTTSLVSVTPKSAPEPGILALLAIGFVGFGLSRRKKSV